MIRKPIGAKLPSCKLPGASFVNTEVIEGSDGMPDLLMRPSLPGELVAYLRRIPSRHRHILAALDFKFYTALVKLEGEAKALADEVEASAKRH